jgi:hypothetical protein
MKDSFRQSSLAARADAMSPMQLGVDGSTVGGYSRDGRPCSTRHGAPSPFSPRPLRLRGEILPAVSPGREPFRGVEDTPNTLPPAWWPGSPHSLAVARSRRH